MLAHLWYQPIGLLLFFIAANSSTDIPSLRGSGCYSVSQSSLTLRPHRLQHTRSPCPSASPRVCPNSCPLSQRCQKTISSCYPPLLPSIFPSMRVFSDKSALCIKWQSIGVSASASVLPMNIQDWFPLEFTGDWVDLLAVQGTLQSLLQHHSLTASIPWHSTFSMVQLAHPYMTTGKIIPLTI